MGVPLIDINISINNIYDMNSLGKPVGGYNGGCDPGLLFPKCRDALAGGFRQGNLGSRIPYLVVAILMLLKMLACSYLFWEDMDV